MWAQVIQHSDCTVRPVTNKGTERWGEVSVSIFNNMWGVSGTESLSGKPQNFFVGLPPLQQGELQKMNKSPGDIADYLIHNSSQLVPFSLSQLWLLELINTVILGLAEEDILEYLKLMVLLTYDSMMIISIQWSSWLNNLSLPFYCNGCLPWIFFEIALMNTNFLDHLPLITIKWQSVCSLLDNKTNTEYFTFRSCFIMCKLIMHMYVICMCILFLIWFSQNN